YFGDHISNKLSIYFDSQEAFKISISGFVFSFLVLFSISLRRRVDYIYLYLILFIVAVLFLRIYFPIFYRFYNMSLLLYLIAGLSYFSRFTSPMRTLPFWCFFLFLFLNSITFVMSISGQHDKYLAQQGVNID